MPLVIQASLRVRGLTSEPHHWWAMVLASRRMPDLSPTREPMMPASSGAQTAGSVSSGISTTLRCGDLGRAEAVGKEVVFLGGGLRELVGRLPGGATVR